MKALSLFFLFFFPHCARSSLAIFPRILFLPSSSTHSSWLGEGGRAVKCFAPFFWASVEESVGGTKEGMAGPSPFPNRCCQAGRRIDCRLVGGGAAEARRIRGGRGGSRRRRRRFAKKRLLPLSFMESRSYEGKMRKQTGTRNFPPFTISRSISRIHIAPPTFPRKAPHVP